MSKEKTMSKEKKIILTVIAALLFVTAIASWLYLSNLEVVPEYSVAVYNNGNKKVIDLDGLKTEPLKGEVVDGKGESKEVDGVGVPLETLLGTDDYTEVTITSDDGYSVIVRDFEMSQAWIQVKDGKARLYVFGDDNSKRNVKNVVRIDVR